MGELHYFLGVQVTKTARGGLILSQEKYVRDLLKKADMENCKPCQTPLPSSVKFSAFGGSVFKNPKLYRSVVGSLQYLTITRPELAYSVGKVSQFMQTPLDEHWKLVKRMLRYVSGTASFGLHLHKTTIHNIRAYSDSDWGGDPDDRKSTGGFCVFLGENLISWSSKKQGAVARSSTEAEYRAMADLVAELIWIKGLMIELRAKLSTPPSMFCDNLSAVLLAANPILHSKSKHFETDLQFVRDYVAKQVVQVSHVPGTIQLADVLTKSLPSATFLEFRSKLMVEDLKKLNVAGLNQEESREEAVKEHPENSKRNNEATAERPISRGHDGVVQLTSLKQQPKRPISRGDERVELAK
ncbi:uncharacterized mitochondrial protein AtMg00810-like [Arachis hypogaea]|uniref:uncharacterized mitochondrial protein AtMg00810-like n=1 Tax=Arachis hypogaea TaxID=3818 RepID=UPI000DEC6C8F|nr:uncharacterized protein LOC112730287 [Arachis hypogaea]